MKRREEAHKDDYEKHIQDHVEEVSTLKAFANDIKARLNVYIPNKTDNVDVKLGQYLNSYPDKRKLKFTFIRQGQGKYVFGTRMVHVVVDGVAVCVTTGSRKIPIGEFIDEFTPKELLQFESRDPMKRLAGNEDEEAALDQTLTASKSMKRLDSKATMRTSASKSPLKRSGN